LGAFETLNGCASPAALSLALKDAATRHHGAAGVAWLRAIVNDRDKLADLITGGVRQFVAENTPPDAAGQVLRVAQRFGLVAVAGELATHYG
jgi:putative DNA primase/helicase